MKPPTEVEADFDVFWESYPMKKGKTKAEEHWHRIKPDLSEVMASLEMQKKERLWLESQKRFVPEWPYGSTWVNQQRWRDGYDPDFEKHLKYEQEAPLRRQKEQERNKQKIRDDYQEYLEGKSTQALKDLKKDTGHLTSVCGWLIEEIIEQRR